jgi:hypothetical protein
MGRFRHRSLAVACAIAALAAAGSPAIAADHNWKLQTEWGGGPLMELGAKAFA